MFAVSTYRRLARPLCFFAALLPLLFVARPAQAELRVLTEQSPPGEYLAPDGRVTGPTAEMVRELMHRVGETAEIELHPWKRAYDYALSDRQIALFETSRTPEREALFKWVGPIKRIHRGLYALAENATPLADADAARQASGICAYAGDSAAEYLLRRGFTNIAQPTLPQQCLSMVLHKRVALWMSSDIETANHLSALGLAPDYLRNVLDMYSIDLYIAFSRSVPDSVIDRWQNALDQMKRDGTLARFYEGTYSKAMINELSTVE